jgi:uncharacterized membrane protein
LKVLSRRLAGASLIALILLCLAWEGWLAPLKPGGSWLILKAVPLLLPLQGILHGRRYTYQWSAMFILLYFTEGVVRAWSDGAMSAALAMGEIALSLCFLVSAAIYARLTGGNRGNAGYPADASPSPQPSPPMGKE